MSNETITSMESGDIQIWDVNVQVIGCDNCDKTFLITKSEPAICPLCGKAGLNSRSAVLRTEPPELIIPHQIDNTRLLSIYNTFTKGVYFKPDSFSSETLKKNAFRLFFPMWLVDGNVFGSWKAEAGYDYQVKSSQEFYSGSQWQSREKLETRIRWEPRLGQIRRHYDNVVTPAIQNMEKLQQAIGSYAYNQAQSFNPANLKESLIRVPDLLPKTLQGNAEKAMDQLASKDCSNACEAQHIRNFSINAEYQELNWTQFLLPVYVSYYFDDKNEPQLVYVNGQNGKISGPKYSSQKKGLTWAGIIAAIGIALFIIGLLLTLAAALFPPLSAIGILLIVIAFLFLIGAVYPAVYPWQNNRKQHPLTILTTKNK